MRDQTAAPPRFSVVVPFHNEQESVVELHRQLSEVMTGKYEPVEFIYVDDQSSDATPQLLTKIAQEDPRVAVLRLKRNYGQTTALAAGFDFASGDIIISSATVTGEFTPRGGLHSKITATWLKQRSKKHGRR